MSLKQERWVGLLSLLPAFLLLAIFVGYPMLNTFFHSFTSWDGVTSKFIGLSNFKNIITNGDLPLMLRNNLIFLLSVPGILLISLVVSVLLHEEVLGWRFFRSVYYLPSILSTVVIGFLVKTMFSGRGVVNTIMESVGLGDYIVSWLENVPAEFMILILCFYWQTLGQGTLIFLSGLSSISPELYDAAKIDGTTWWQRLFHIIIPSLYPTIFYFTIVNVIYVFVGLFGLVFAVTGGGPGYETTPIDYMIYIQAFKSGNMGYASALSMFLFVIVMFITWIQLKISKRLDQ
ncbi:ABC transporter permease [Paenibacillus baekrokdamisoli]|uniref:ABC transporter permease n=1 Tax=Paenibacillus baekrokdamisoli TaxID=1712516 RepID=A0A3G9J5X1_9BACL|nr:sugar ABC transporter permease [Paenibacillus baekrokdamisoli]MBB3067676.1 ABC-type sugar transport system permease subunit [Paenibacillus baekrokdamisoli]BBH19138.1 ABC transporter permease [Paenibacillus baekrokdamisoli]